MHQIDPKLTGTELAAIRREINRRDGVNYAAAVGDLNPRYFDDTSPEGVVAPPMMAVAITWPMVVKAQETLGKSMPPEAVATMVHATEHLAFHRPLKPGDRLKIEGKIAAIKPTRAGAYLVFRMDAKEGKGKPVFTEHFGTIFRGIECADVGHGEDKLPDIPQLPESSSALWSVEVHVPREMSYVYDGCTDIFFPIHTSPAFAKGVGLPDIILQGTATCALAARELINREGGGRPEMLREIACRFSAMVIPGSDIKVELINREAKNDDVMLGFRVVNAGGAFALKDGYAKLSS